MQQFSDGDESDISGHLIKNIDKEKSFNMLNSYSIDLFDANDAMKDGHNFSRGPSYLGYTKDPQPPPHNPFS